MSVVNPTNPIPFAVIHRIFLQTVGFDRASLHRKVAELANLARAEWVRLGLERCHTTARDYVRGIQRVEWRRQDLAVIALESTRENPLPIMVEEGWDEHDLRETMLKEGMPGVRRSRAGHLYRFIPFRHGTPGTAGVAGLPMGMAYAHRFGEEAAKELGEAVYAEARRLIPTIFIPGRAAGPWRAGRIQQTIWGERLEEGMAPPLRERHVTDIYADMVRQQATYKGRTSGSYRTWRGISQNPDTFRSDKGPKPQGNWRHPGIKARHLVDEVATYVAGLVPSVMGA